MFSLITSKLYWSVNTRFRSFLRRIFPRVWILELQRESRERCSSTLLAWHNFLLLIMCKRSNFLYGHEKIIVLREITNSSLVVSERFNNFYTCHITCFTLNSISRFADEKYINYNWIMFLEWIVHATNGPVTGWLSWRGL